MYQKINLVQKTNSHSSKNSPTPALNPRVGLQSLSSTSEILALQRILGNKAVLQLYYSNSIPINSTLSGTIPAATILLKTPATSPTIANPKLTELVHKLSSTPTIQIKNSTEWQDIDQLWKNPLYRPQLKVALKKYFESLVIQKTLTFETISEAERKFFLKPEIISTTQREELRRQSLLNSKLFQAITSIHLDPSAVDPKDNREMVDQKRLPPIGTTENKHSWYLSANSLAYKIGYSELTTQVFAEITTTPSTTTNQKLADYVKSQPGADTEVHHYACGIGNIFAIAVSRDKAEPTSAGFLTWFKNWSFGTPNNKAIVNVKEASNGHKSLGFNPGEVLQELAAKHKITFSGGEVVTETNDKGETTSKRNPDFVAHGNPNNDQTLFNASIAKGANLGTRVGVAQHTSHMYVVYKDLDGIWRPMDIYLDYSDKPEGGLTNPGGYSIIKKYQLLIQDKPL